MTIEQITDIAYEVASELEPSRSVDVFDVTDSHILFETEHGLKRGLRGLSEWPAKRANQEAAARMNGPFRNFG